VAKPNRSQLALKESTNLNPEPATALFQSSKSIIGADQGRRACQKLQAL
jgi:hypothetical protein